MSDRDEQGRFTDGNMFWKMRSSHGANPKFENEEDLKAACEEYFEWVTNSPLYEDKVGFYEGSATHTPVAKMHAMTLDGLCIFLGISIVTWRDWRDKRADLSSVISWAESVIKHQKFIGAAAGLLNANIISRDLGLVDKSDMTSDGERLEFVTMAMGDKKLNEPGEKDTV